MEKLAQKQHQQQQRYNVNRTDEMNDERKADTAQRLKYLRITEEQTQQEEEQILQDTKKRQVKN